MALFLIAAFGAAYFAGTRNAIGKRDSFEQLTFLREYIRGARFTPDGQSVIYSASWEGRPYEVFSSHIGDHNARSLDLKNAIVVAAWRQET